MDSQIIGIATPQWRIDSAQPDWIAALESGKVLYLRELAFELSATEQTYLTPDIRDPGSRNINRRLDGSLRGVRAADEIQAGIGRMLERFSAQAVELIESLLPRYRGSLRLAPTSFRPSQVETRVQSWRADDRRLHVDAFPSRPNRGERILRVFANVNPQQLPRVWRVGEPFEQVAQRFLPTARRYSSWRARLLNQLRVTKSLRSEYDHLMLQLHDGMKRDADYQRDAAQVTQRFEAGSVWICFSDQTSHAVMSGQFMLEQTLHLPVARQYQPECSPLQILQRLTGRTLI